MTDAGARERGNVAARDGDWKTAEQHYTAAIVADRMDGFAWSNRALAYLKLGQPLLAYGDAWHAFQCLPPMGNVKAAARYGMACDAMQIYDESVKAYTICLHFAPDAAFRRDIEERLAKTNAARVQKEAADAVAKPQVLMGAHKTSAVATDPVAREKIARSFLSGWASMPRSYRSGEGGPRHPSAVIAAFGSGFSTDLATLKDMGPKGVGVVATRDIPAGTLIHVDEPLLASCMQGLRPGGLKDCYHCTRPVPAAAAVPCACDRVYCSAACKAAAMALYHAPLCSMADGTAVAKLEARAATGVSASSRFILVMWKMLGAALVRAKATGRPLESPPDAPPFCHLARTSDLPSPEPAERPCMGGTIYITSTWELLWEVVSETLLCEPALSIRWVCDAVHLLGTNVMSIGGKSWPTIASRGQALMGVGSMFNHSCDFNVQEVSDSDTTGPAIMFITERDVKKGEELNISYCDTDVPRDNRQVTLANQYGFVCDCPKCKAEA